MFAGCLLAGLALSGVLTAGEPLVPPKAVTAAPRAQLPVPSPCPPKDCTPPLRIKTRLAKAVTCSFSGVALRHALDSLHTLSGINFVLDADALSAANISADTPITMKPEH